MTREEQEKIIYENIPKVYEAGAVSIKNEVAGALEGFASGEAVALKDVSKVEHDLGVRVSSENISDISAVKLRVQGGNLLDVDNAKLISDKLTNVIQKEHILSGIKITNAVEIISNSIGAGFRIGSTAEMIGKTYTISFDEFVSGVSDTPKGIWIIVYKDDDRSQSYIEQGYVGNNAYFANIASNAEQNSLTFTIPTDVNFDFYNVGVLFDFNRGREVEAGTVVEYKGVSLVPGTVAATEYEPYVEPIEYSVNADGTVEGVKSLYPSTTLTTDTVGALIEVDYNRDINKAFEEIRKVILSLGGTL